MLDRRYQVGRRLGEGGMSYVYRAQDDRDRPAGGGQDSAAPALARSRPRSSGSGARPTIATRLDHPNVCPILRLGETRTG